MRFSFYPAAIILLVSVFLFPSRALHAASSPKIHSIASFYNIGTEQYRAAIYANDGSELLTTEAAHKAVNGMAFKIKRTRWRARSWIRDLNQRVAINNDAAQLHALSKSIVELSQLFEKPFYNGDLIEIERNSNVLAVKVNGLLIGELSGTALFPLLLNAWLGDIPPSSEFKQSLLGPPVSYSEAQTFLALDDINQRQARVQNWLSEPTTAAPKNSSLDANDSVIEENSGIEATLTEIEPPIAAISDEVVEVLPVPVTKLSPQKPALIESITDRDLKPDSDITTNASARTDRNAQMQQLLIIKPTQLSSSALNISDPEGDTAMPVEESPVPIEKKLAYIGSDEPAADASVGEKARIQSDELTQYRELLKRHTTPHIKYPLRSQAKLEQGVVGIKVTIDRAGQVLDASINNSSSYSRLDRAALVSVKRANPFPTLPKSISGDQLEFVLPLAFRLQ